MRRLNDTKALVGQPIDGNVTHTVSSRKIENGYLVRTSTSNDATGEYRCSERFQANAPNITPAKVGRGSSSPDAGNPLRDAVDYMK